MLARAEDREVTMQFPGISDLTPHGRGTHSSPALARKRSGLTRSVGPGSATRGPIPSFRPVPKPCCDACASTCSTHSHSPCLSRPMDSVYCYKRAWSPSRSGSSRATINPPAYPLRRKTWERPSVAVSSCQLPERLSAEFPDRR